MNNDIVGTNLFRLHYKLSYQKPSFLQKPMRSLHRKTVALVMRSLVGVQKSSTQMVPGPFPDIPAEGAQACPLGTRGVVWQVCHAERRPMPGPCITVLV